MREYLMFDIEGDAPIAVPDHLETNSVTGQGR